MKEILESIIGSYVPVEVTEGVYQIDWEWIGSLALFITLVACTAWFACKVICGVLHD